MRNSNLEDEQASSEDSHIHCALASSCLIFDLKCCIVSSATSIKQNKTSFVCVFLSRLRWLGWIGSRNLKNYIFALDFGEYAQNSHFSRKEMDVFKLAKKMGRAKIASILAKIGSRSSGRCTLVETATGSVTVFLTYFGRNLQKNFSHQGRSIASLRFGARSVEEWAGMAVQSTHSPLRQSGNARLKPKGVHQTEILASGQR